VPWGPATPLGEVSWTGTSRGARASRVWIGLVLILSGGLVLGIGREGGAESPEPARVVKIGVAGPMSGGMGQLGRAVRQAVEAQAEEWNERGGVLGLRIELVVEDDRGDPTEAVAAAERLVRAGVWGVIGHLTSASSLPASAVYHAAGIPQITPSSTDPRLTEQRFSNLFRTCGRDDRQGMVAATFVLKTLAPSRVIVVHDRTSYGQALAAAFRRTIAQRDPEVALTTVTLSPQDRDLARVVGLAKREEPDIVYFAGIFREAGPLVKRLRDEGVMAAFVTGDGVIGTEFVALAGEAAATGTYLTFAPDPRHVPSAKDAIKRFESRHGAIGPYTLSAYDAAGALLAAIRRARPKAANRAQLRLVSQTLHQMTYEGANGKLRWDWKGDLVSQPYVVYRAKKGGGFQGWFEQVTGRASRR
jgi:branched-chain amino acid transport system substrate-binding protein